MDFDEAKRCLLLHGSGYYDEDGNPIALDEGFLGSLRPYRGLREANFHQVMEALLVVGEQVYSSSTVERELLESLWSMCHTARLWALEPDGMLQRNNLIDPQEIELLSAWVKCVEETALSLLRGCPPYYQAETYAQYIIDHGHGSNIEFFVKLMTELLSDEDCCDPTVVAQALGSLGGKAQTALPYLRKAALREYTTYSPAEVHTAEIRIVLEAAIKEIEDSVSK